MIFGEYLDIAVALEGCKYTKLQNPTFKDKHGYFGTTIGGRFQTLDDLREECKSYDVYIYSLQKARQEWGDQCFWAVYSCREK